MADPVCDMDVYERSAKWSSRYNGKKYLFCTPGRKKHFDRGPEKFLNK